ncbi:MAG: hypothetical protein Q4C18_06770 [Eubacteriales bacterium]|nr:hypothetical protein [Eubacteriales bacterium]
MIIAKPTKNLTGITLEGEFDDFYEIVDCIYRMTGVSDSYDDPYWGVKNRLLGICYEIRHAYQGDRNVILTENGVYKELMKQNSMILPQNNVHFSVEILFPEAVFVALSVSELYVFGHRYYKSRATKREEDRGLRTSRYSNYVRDQALLDLLSATILQALADVIGDDELEKLLKYRTRSYDMDDLFLHYVTHYIDKCNIEYLKTVPEKRKDKLRNIAKRIVQKPASYEKMKMELEYAAQEYDCSIYELCDPKLEYPENIEW